MWSSETFVQINCLETQARWEVEKKNKELAKQEEKKKARKKKRK